MKVMFVTVGGSQKGVANTFVDVRLQNDMDALFVLMSKGQLETENKRSSLYMPNTKAIIQVHHMRCIIKRCIQMSLNVV